MKINLPNGIVLDTEGGWAASATAYAVQKGFSDVRVFWATHPDGTHEYLIAQGEEPVFSSQNFEAIGAHIDIMALDRDMK